MQPAGDLVARLGGDEFAIIWPDVPAQAELTTRAREIVETVSRPYIIDGHHIVIGASVGSALYPRDAEASETLLQYADIALYRAKSLGRNGFQFFDQELRDEIQTRARLGSELRGAIAGNGLTLHFQPLYSMPGNRLSACEALVRWHHPTQGMIPPDQFVGLAEENGLIHDLGNGCCARPVLKPPAGPHRSGWRSMSRPSSCATRVSSALSRTRWPSPACRPNGWK
ncbi:diguanylate cyclase [Komagataeibacter rhaeticus]|nr:diguanylate cyclase [Komagataeibacter rhaeticus]